MRVVSDGAGGKALDNAVKDSNGPVCIVCTNNGNQDMMTAVKYSDGLTDPRCIGGEVGLLPEYNTRKITVIPIDPDGGTLNKIVMATENNGKHFIMPQEPSYNNCVCADWTTRARCICGPFRCV
jgi:hypothetical protein